MIYSTCCRTIYLITLLISPTQNAVVINAKVPIAVYVFHSIVPFIRVYNRWPPCRLQACRPTAPRSVEAWLTAL